MVEKELGFKIDLLFISLFPSNAFHSTLLYFTCFTSVTAICSPLHFFPSFYLTVWLHSICREKEELNNSAFPYFHPNCPEELNPATATPTHWRRKEITNCNEMNLLMVEYSKTDVQKVEHKPDWLNIYHSIPHHRVRRKTHFVAQHSHKGNPPRKITSKTK